MISTNKLRQLIDKEEEGPTLDYKENLDLETDGDEAQFIKDALSLANNGEEAHIICGVEDGIRKLVGIKTPHKAEQLNDILKDKCDPPLCIEYAEKKILGHKVGVIEITGDNPPYIIAVHDRYGGKLSKNPKDYCYIWRGMVFTRAFNKNEGVSRADLDKMYKVKYTTLEADLQIMHDVSVKSLDDSLEVDINFILENEEDAIATDTYILVHFKNIKQVEKCEGGWIDLSSSNENRPVVRLICDVPVIQPVRIPCGSVVVKVDNHIKQIEANMIIGATNMRTKEGPYSISLKEQA